MASPLIDAARLNAMLTGSRPPVVLDIRWTLQGGADAEGYARGHIPGARFLHMERELSGVAGAGGRHPLPGAQEFAQAVRRAGVNGDSVVVCYDDGPGVSASRAWWLLRHFGHRDAFVLDGGLAAWTAAGFPLSTDEPEVSEGDFTLGETLAPAIDSDEVLDAAQDGVLLDARDNERFQGITEPVDKVAGHIPGAVSAPTAANTGPDGRLRSAEELRERFEALGVSGDKPVTVYCGSGITAAHEILALEHAGYAAALYPGSWSHWIEDPANPVETGPGRG
jgi:thiosulfate/3-mercaptopyruvate sulfurtransferase